jgi:beta-glucan synthesis-associated protein KRE6
MTDVDTPVSKRSTTRFHDGANLTLVMSDEYEVNGRSFGPGEDAFFEAIDQPGQETSKELQYYNSSTEFVTTRDGYLVIVTKRQQTTTSTFDYESYSTISQTYDYTSALIQSWNKFCFTGGVLEISVQLPGRYDSGGLWPAIWMMGNLGESMHFCQTIFNFILKFSILIFYHNLIQLGL